MRGSVRIVLGIVFMAIGVVAIGSPYEVGELLGRPATTSSEVINLRATWGGSLLGIGLAIALARREPWGRRIVAAIQWLMVGIGGARLVGFVRDGDPDYLQWVWLGAEVAIAVGCAWWLMRRRRAAEPSGS